MRNSNVDIHSWLIPPSGNQSTQLPSSRLTFVLQCDHRKAYPQSLESSHFHILPEGEVPNSTRHWGNKRRLGAGARMLPGSLGVKRKPSMGN